MEMNQNKFKIIIFNHKKCEGPPKLTLSGEGVDNLEEEKNVKLLDDRIAEVVLQNW